jgi:XTP/dITP diphosphohydrolase
VQSLIFATANLHKLEEVRPLLKGNVALSTPAQHGLADSIPEDGDTLEHNALQKARYVFERLHCAVFADDTGLEVDALNGAPGVRSARYAGEDKDPQANIRKLLHELEGEANRRARFRTVMALIVDGKEWLFEGAVEGDILCAETKGSKGFGYDPIFRPAGYDISFAEMNLAEKNAISHRGQAVKKLVDFLNAAW